LQELSQVVRARGFGQATGDTFSISDSVGGVRGVVESVLPVTLFSVVFGFVKELQPALIAGIVPAVLLVAVRVFRRERLDQAFAGLIGIGIGAFLASRTGNAADVFVPSIIKNGVFVALYAGSVLVRWPLIGVLVGSLLGDPTGWRADPVRMRVFRRATWLWAGMFAIRLAVQVPLYYAGQVALLGTLNALVLGIPLWVLTLWLTWLLVRRVLPAPGAHADPVGSNRAATDPAGTDLATTYLAETDR
jgi:hypothetical protein